MIRTSFLSLAVLSLLFSNVSFAAAPQDDIQCKVEQDQINTAVFMQGILTQSYRACSKGTIAALEVVAAVEFNGGSVDVHIKDEQFNTRAMKTFTADNFNGRSFYLDNLAIPSLKGDDFTIMIKTLGNAECILPGTDDAAQFIGDVHVNGTPEGKNIKFAAHFRGASSDMGEANTGRTVNNLGTDGSASNAHARVAAGLDLSVQGDCESAQRMSTGVLNFEGETVIQTFQSCERGRVTEIKVATPFVEPGFEYEYALGYTHGDVICGGTFTSENVSDGELLLELDKGAVRKGQSVMLKMVIPTGARIAVLAAGSNDFGRLFIDGQASAYNIAMAAGLDAATASDVQSSDDDGRNRIELGAYPVPFDERLSITVRGTVADGALLQLLDHQGMPVEAISLTGGKQNAPIRFNNLSNLRPGLYTVRLLSGRTVASKRILKG
ncbi:MAG: T9SS C-terminal target domain-containing protein [Crocinitomicaceae bacterium TMED114]|nr:MAG: T9SS C-terminal target domain-containing protein [Crocinitomicaceae bacterium TMED114]